MEHKVGYHNLQLGIEPVLMHKPPLAFDTYFDELWVNIQDNSSTAAKFFDYDIYTKVFRFSKAYIYLTWC